MTNDPFERNTEDTGEPLGPVYEGSFTGNRLGPNWASGQVPARWRHIPMPPAPEKPDGLPLPFCEAECPACAAVCIFDGAHDRDAVICMGCRALLVLEGDFHAKLTVTGESPRQSARLEWVCMSTSLRRPTDEEEVMLLSHPAVRRGISLVARHHSQHGSPHPGITPPDAGPAPY